MGSKVRLLNLYFQTLLTIENGTKMLKNEFLIKKYMSKKSNHVVPSKSRNGWAVKKSGSTRSSKKFSTKEEAIQYGREISKKEESELYIHKKDGKIQDRRSYGTDPFPPKG